MKKPDRKAFQREYGPRAAAKYVRAMQKYRRFLKNQPKPKAATPKTEPKAAPKPPKPPKPPKTEAKPTTKTESKPSGSGVHGQFRKVGDPGPNVTKPYGQLDRSGARIRRNQEDARRSRTSRNADVRAASGSNRRNDAAIKAEVDRNSGGSTESQRAKERRQRLARERAARRNRLNLLARRHNDM